MTVDVSRLFEIPNSNSVNYFKTTLNLDGQEKPETLPHQQEQVQRYTKHTGNQLGGQEQEASPDFIRCKSIKYHEID